MLRTHALNCFTAQTGNQPIGNYRQPASGPTGAIGAKGSWYQILDQSSGNPIASKDGYGIQVQIFANTAATSRPLWLDVGYDPAGGTAYTTVISNFQCGGGALTVYTTMGRSFFFPMYFGAGGTIALRTQGLTSTVVYATVKVLLSPSNPSNIWVGKYSETIGTTTGSLGTTFTPGNGVKGAWTSLGTTTCPLQYFQLGVHCNNTIVTAQSHLLDLAYGDGTTFVPIISNMRVGSTTNEEFYNQLMPPELCYRDVPAGSTLYVRGGSSGVPDTGWHASATGIGG